MARESNRPMAYRKKLSKRRFSKINPAVALVDSVHKADAGYCMHAAVNSLQFPVGTYTEFVECVDVFCLAKIHRMDEWPGTTGRHLMGKTHPHADQINRSAMRDAFADFHIGLPLPVSPISTNAKDVLISRPQPSSDAGTAFVRFVMIWNADM